MNVYIQIPDDAMSKMLATGNRIQGSISLANAKEGNFHPHNLKPRHRDKDRKIVMLRCGKAVASADKLYLTLEVKRDCVEYPVTTIMDDCQEARDFFEEFDK